MELGFCQQEFKYGVNILLTLHSSAEGSDNVQETLISWDNTVMERSLVIALTLKLSLNLNPHAQVNLDLVSTPISML